MRRFFETTQLFLLGGGVYGFLEILWRGYTHWTMVLLGGGLFLMLGRLGALLPQRLGLLRRGLIGGAVITGAEFLAGWALNLQLGLHVWDYSRMPLQLFGQICLPYSLLWVVLAVLAQVFDCQIRRLAWGEEGLDCPIF